MAALNQETRLVMTILFVGTLSGANVFAYAKFGMNFPYGALAHSILFGLGTIGSIMIMKALFDLSLNDRIELILLDRKIAAYWERKARDEQQKKKMMESAKQFSSPPSFYTQPQPQSRMVRQEEENIVGAEFLTSLQ
tara:strand:- start:164 stop:574 length:411 start_codon:yes stop_codon:yes gene_type:complete